MTGSTVTWQQPGLLAMSETDGHGDTCGPIVIADYLHVTQGFPLNVASIDALRARLIAQGYMGQSGGMTLNSIAAALLMDYGVHALVTVSWTPTLNTAQFHADLLAAMAHHQAVVMQTHNAAALPDNQPGVQEHFILLWGIDSVRGYWACNGDTETALRAGGAVSPVWYTWANLLASQPDAYCVLPAFGGAPPMDPMYFTANPDGSYTCKSTGQILAHGMLAFYEAEAGLTRLGLPITGEYAVGGSGHTPQPTAQDCERGRMVYDPARVYDNPPGARGDVYYGHCLPPPPPPPVHPCPDNSAALATLKSALLSATTAADVIE